MKCVTILTRASLLIIINLQSTKRLITFVYYVPVLVLWSTVLQFWQILYYIYIYITLGWTVQGSNPVGGEIFHPSRPVLGPTQPPVQWVLGLSQG